MLSPGDHPVVVGVDGSRGSHNAVAWAVCEAARRGARLRLVASYLDDHLTADEPGPTARAETDADPWLGSRLVAEEAAEDARLAASLDPRADVEKALVTGWPAEALLEESSQASLLVVGARGLGGVRDVVLGSVSMAVAQRAACPVVVVRELPSRSLPDLKVVVGVSGPADAAALDFAFREASLWGSGLTVAHTWRLDAVAAAESLSSRVDGSGPGRRERRVVHDMVQPLRERYPSVEVVQSVVEGHPADHLVRLSENARLVVVSSRGRGTLLALLLGSVSSKVLHLARCPVAVVHERSGEVGGRPNSRRRRRTRPV